MQIAEFVDRLFDLQRRSLAQAEIDGRQVLQMALTVKEARDLLKEINDLRKAFCRAREGLGHQTNIGCSEEHCEKCMHWVGVEQDLQEEVKSGQKK